MVIATNALKKEVAEPHLQAAGAASKAREGKQLLASAIHRVKLFAALIDRPVLSRDQPVHEGSRDNGPANHSGTTIGGPEAVAAAESANASKIRTDSPSFVAAVLTMMGSRPLRELLQKLW